MPNISSLGQLAQSHLSPSPRATISRTKERFVRYKVERLLSFATGSRTIWSLPKAIFSNFHRLSSPVIRNSADDLVCESNEKAEVFLPGLLEFHFIAFCPTSPASFSPIVPSFLRRISTGTISQAVYYLNVFKAPGLDGISPMVLKCVPLSWLLLTYSRLPFLQTLYLPSLLETLRWFSYS